MNENASCPCCSSRAYGACCLPFHRGPVEAPTPEALMRSRYAAFALGEVEHLWRTLHPSHEDRARDPAVVKKELKRACNRRAFPRLAILSVEDEDASGAAFVTFRATVVERGVDVGFTERSEFRRDGGAWRYVRGAGAA